MQFSTTVSVAAVAAVANAQFNTTATENQTTLVTITDCVDHVCTETVSPAIISTVTSIKDNTITKYTTWCPLTTSEENKETKTVKNPSATAPAAENSTEKKPEHATTVPAAGSPSAVAPAAPPAAEHSTEKKPEKATTAPAAGNPSAVAPATEHSTEEKPEHTTTAPATAPATADGPASSGANPTTFQSTKKQETTASVSPYVGAAAQVLPAAGALVAGAVALLL